MARLSPQSIADFQAKVREHYREGGRDFLWRQRLEPYVIHVSEIMLQQTQTSRVAKLLPAFLDKFGDYAALAGASTGEVIAAWQGLGYNRRAMNLHLAARTIVADFSGSLPADRSALESLPGIGTNTAGAILAYAWDRAEPFVETNIRTVYLHEFKSLDGVLSAKPKDREILDLVRQTMPEHRIREWFWALMDYGVYLKKTVGNLSREVQGYKPQSRFDGSVRQARGAILRELAQAGGACSREGLRRACGAIDEERYQRALRDLADEGMVIAEAEQYGLP